MKHDPIEGVARARRIANATFWLHIRRRRKHTGFPVIFSGG
jgi:hypothetical protein